MSNSVPYAHPDLQNEGSEIRLLTIQPGEPSDPIVTSISIAVLTDPQRPPYEAISYVWGDETLRADVLIDGTVMSITSSLEAALRRVRLPAEQRVVWADAICINQTNVLEKNHQVALMGDIYRGCRRCLAWLGEDDGSVARAFDWMAGTQEGHLNLDVCEGRPCLSRIQAADQLFQRPWFSRVWTIQEALLPSEVVVLCGANSLELEVVVRMLENMSRHWTVDRCCSLGPQCVDCFGGLVRLVIVASTFTLRGSFQNGLINDTSLGVANLLDSFRGRDVSNPLDRVYGVLGMIPPDEESGLQRIDYSLSLPELFTKVVVEDIRKSGSLSAFKCVSYPGESMLNLPSWVPDWSKFTKAAFNAFLKHDLFNACASNSPDAITILDEKVLSISTMLVDTVDIVGRTLPRPTITATPDISILQEWSHLLFDAENSDVLYLPPGLATMSPSQEQSMQTAFWHTLTTDCIQVGSEHRRNGLGGSQAAFQNLQSYIDHGGMDGHAFDEESILWLYHYACDRRLFITAAGWFGNGPEQVRAGDEIHVAAGGKCPLILRPKIMTVEGNSAPVYTLVGDCYLHGIMDGEAAVGFAEKAQRVLIV